MALVAGRGHSMPCPYIAVGRTLASPQSEKSRLGGRYERRDSRTVPPYRYSFAAPVAAPPKAEERSYRERFLAAVDHLPPLPAVLSRVLRMLNDEYCSSTQIASLIEKDSVLSGSVLRCVNSSYYGLMQRVSSIRQSLNCRFQ